MYRVIERANIGKPTTDQPYGQWGWMMDGEEFDSVPDGLGSVVISGNVGHGFDFVRGLEELKRLLSTIPLRPDYSGYDTNPVGWQTLKPIWPAYPGIVRFSGNFAEYSFAFNFDTNDAELIAELVGLIDANKATPAYAAMVAEWKKAEEQEAERQRIKEEKRRKEYADRLRFLMGQVAQ